MTTLNECFISKGGYKRAGEPTCHILTHPHQSFTPNPRLSSVRIAALFLVVTGGSARGCNRSRTQQSLISFLKHMQNILYLRMKEMFIFFPSLENPESLGWTKCFSSQRCAVIAGLVINGPAAESNDTQTHPRGSQQLDTAPAAPRLGELAFMPA